MKTILLFAFLLINHPLMASWQSCGNYNSSLAHASVECRSDTTKIPRLSFTIINGIKSTFGYNIFVDGKLLVHQPNIPGLSGQMGFLKKSDAEKVAQLVIKKIRDGIMPPAVTRQEMEKLGVSLK